MRTAGASCRMKGYALSIAAHAHARSCSCLTTEDGVRQGLQWMTEMTHLNSTELQVITKGLLFAEEWVALVQQAAPPDHALPAPLACVNMTHKNVCKALTVLGTCKLNRAAGQLDPTSSVMYRRSNGLAFLSAVDEPHLVPEPGHPSAANGNAALQSILRSLLGPQLVPNGGQQAMLRLLWLLT